MIFLKAAMRHGVDDVLDGEQLAHAMSPTQPPNVPQSLDPAEQDAALLLEIARPQLEAKIVEAAARGPEWCLLVLDRNSIVAHKRHAQVPPPVVALLTIEDAQKRYTPIPGFEIDFAEIRRKSLERDDDEIGVLLLSPTGVFFLPFTHKLALPGPRTVVVVGLDTERIASVVARIAAEETRIHLLFPEAGFHPRRHWDQASSLIMSRQRSVIGTHSEVLIATIGGRIDASEISQTDIQVILVDEKVHVPVKSYFFDGTGALIDWPSAFFSALPRGAL